MTPQDALKTLEERATHLPYVDYEEIVDLFERHIQRIPIPVAKLSFNTSIDRVRPNNGEQLFTTLAELNYITDEQMIMERLTEFGRSNCPHQPMFYGAVESTQVRHQRLTAIAETSTLYQNPNGICLDGELYTVSRWRTTEELEVAEMVFSAEAIDANPDTKRAFEKQIEFLVSRREHNEAFYREFLVFISGQFARQKRTHDDCKISVAYTNTALKHPQISAVAYPSVQTQYQGENLVLPPSTVDRALRLESVITQRLHKNAPYMFINNHMECLDPLRDMENFNWHSTDPIHIAGAEEIHAALFPTRPQR